MIRLRELHVATLEEAIKAYKKKFDDVPTIMGIPPEYGQQMADVLEEAVEDDEPLTDDEFRAALGLDPLPEDADA
jgi:hypothetical protein